LLPPSTLLIALMMEAVRSFETMVNFYQTTRRYNPEDSHLCINRRENLKSFLKIHLLVVRTLNNNPAQGMDVCLFSVLLCVDLCTY
jgi:hypothetical protein